MQGLTRMPLEGGGAILFEAGPELELGGPVKAGRAADAIRELPQTLQDALVPVRETARVVLDQLKEAGPDEAEVEFGVNLSSQAGAVIIKSDAAVHLRVRLLWKKDEPTPDAGDAEA
ncbi:CU044_2847 family protein [Streptomyces sp. NBC_00264]|uniref:CU044_2847 family protein n=1 Tax=unclassified Streptomyces TaxID=2593676 RepID=UPI00224C9C0E|nr:MULTISPECIES: CU044_2847 family protein [unclassified Streptomyces]MCX5166152.1 CU044_2847 family protein [Streptomyces sp. NBC_00305]MCX5224669.1 CU044_2847 family protein [Streptomyces sp. NBC_00264]